jgi:hypothetical protein
VQALAGRARTGEGAEPFEEALRSYDDDSLNFAWGSGNAGLGETLFQLALAAEKIGRLNHARELLLAARNAFNPEAREYEISGEEEK